MNEKVILVTGARKGIGRYLAEYYTNAGNSVIGFSRESSDFQSERYEHFCVDVGQEHIVKQIFKEIRRKYSKLDVVINCAAISPSVSHFVLIPPGSIENAYRTNVFGLMNVCREAVKVMMKNNQGRIINVGSMAVKHEIIGDSIYAATKAAVNTFTRVLAKEVNKNGITCNVIAPAAIQTNLSDSMDQSILNDLIQRNAIKGFGKMSDVSNATDWIIQDSSSAITGQVIYLGGA